MPDLTDLESQSLTGAVRFAAGEEDLAAGLRAALDAPDPARQAAGRQLAASYTWPAAAGAHLDFYRSLRSAAARPR